MDAFSPPQLPGLVLRRPLGESADPPWLARADDCSWVVVRRAARPPDLPQHLALVPIYGAVTDKAGNSWVISAYTSGSGLDRRLERVGLVAAAQVVAWGAVLIEALAALHECGLVHGDVQPSRVLLGHRDTVLLDATCATEGGPREAAADLRALVEVLASAGGDRADGPLAAAVTASREGELTARELALTWGRAKRDLVGAPKGGRRERSLRLLAAAGAALGLLAGAAVLGTQLAQVPEQTAALSPPAQVPSSPAATVADAPEVTSLPPVELDWATILAGLDTQRGRAFAAADATLLAAVDVPGSQAHARDLALVEALSAGQVKARGWVTSISSVVPGTVSGDRVELTVVDTLAAYDLLDATGQVVEHQPARAEATWSIALVETPGGWRISSTAKQ